MYLLIPTVLYVISMRRKDFETHLSKFEILKRALANFNQLIASDSSIKLSCTVVFYVKRIIISLVLMCMQKYPSLQLVIIYLSSLLSYIFVGVASPYTTIGMNSLDIFNEFCLLSVLSTYFCLVNPYESSQSLEAIGIAILGMICFHTFV